MIESIERLGTADDNEGYFLINNKVKVRYNEDGTMDLEYNDMEENEAINLAEELLEKSLQNLKGN